MAIKIHKRGTLQGWFFGCSSCGAWWSANGLDVRRQPAQSGIVTSACPCCGLYCSSSAPDEDFIDDGSTGAVAAPTEAAVKKPSTRKKRTDTKKAVTDDV